MSCSATGLFGAMSSSSARVNGCCSSVNWSYDQPPSTAIHSPGGADPAHFEPPLLRRAHEMRVVVDQARDHHPAPQVDLAHLRPGKFRHRCVAAGGDHALVPDCKRLHDREVIVDGDDFA